MPTAHCSITAARDHRLSTGGLSSAFVGLLACSALVLVWRRFCGALVNPLPPALLLSSGILAVFSAAGIRFILHRSFNQKATSKGMLVLDIVLSASLLFFAGSLSLPKTSVLSLCVLWLFIAAEEIWAWLPRSKYWRRSTVNKSEHMPLLRQKQSGEVVGKNVVAENVTQQLTRSIGNDGSEVLSGWLRLDFAAGQRMGNLHVAFCPAFAVTPELTFSQLDGPEARIKIAQLLPYGARLDLKLQSFHSEPANVLVKFSAKAEPSQGD
jgi:hypothetical protein